MLTRRTLIAATAGTAATAAAGALAACEPDAEPPSAAPAAPALDPTDWQSVRGQFALDRDVAHLAAFVFATHPAPVREAIERHRRGFETDPIRYLHTNASRAEEEVSAAAAKYLEARPNEIAFTDSTTMGLGLLYAGLRLGPGDEVLTTTHDFYSTHESLRLRTVRDGTRVRRVPLYAEAARAGVDGIVAAVLGGLTPRTRVLALTWVHSSTGVRLPVRQIAAAVRERAGDRVLICVDAVHGLAAADATPAALGADFFVAGTHKWLFGPRGTGLIWGTEAAWARFTPIIPTFGALYPGASAAGGVTGTPGGYHTFEHRWALAEAFTFQSTVGRPRVAQRLTQLATALKEGLAGISGVTVHTPLPPELSAGIVCCDVAGVPAPEAVHRLWEARVVASVTPYETQLLRFGASIVNDEADVERAVAAVRTLS